VQQKEEPAAAMVGGGAGLAGQRRAVCSRFSFLTPSGRARRVSFVPAFSACTATKIDRRPIGDVQPTPPKNNRAVPYTEQYYGYLES